MKMGPQWVEVQVRGRPIIMILAVIMISLVISKDFKMVVERHRVRGQRGSMLLSHHLIAADREVIGRDRGRGMAAVDLEAALLVGVA